MALGPFRILALDVDGTLLDSEGALRPRTVVAVRRATAAGIRPVLCTGRRYRRARPIAAQLGLSAPIVCNSGAIVKDPCDDRTLWRADFDAPLKAAILELFEAQARPLVGFIDRSLQEADFIVPGFPTGQPYFDDYVRQNREHAEIDPMWPTRHRSLNEPNGLDALFHLCAIGPRPEMLVLERLLLDCLEGRIQSFVQRSPRYLGTMCEILRHDASKWRGVLHLAKLWEIDPSQICAVGDDVNDVPMIRGAGLGVAMGHAPAEVLASADMVISQHEEDGLALLVEEVLLPGV